METKLVNPACTASYCPRELTSEGIEQLKEVLARDYACAAMWGQLGLNPPNPCVPPVRFDKATGDLPIAKNAPVNVDSVRQDAYAGIKNGGSK